MLPELVNKIAKGNLGTNTRFSALQPKSWLLVILLGLLLPPLGLVLVIYLLLSALRLRQKPYYWMIVVVVIATAIGSTAYFKLYSTLYKEHDFKYTYTSLDNHQLSGKLPNTAISFKKPVEIKQAYKQVQEGFATTTLAHTKNPKASPNSGLVSYISTSIAYSALAASDSYVSEVNKLMQEQKGKGYDDYKASLQKQLQSTLPKGMILELGQPSPLSNSNLKQNAWQFDFTAKSKDDNSSGASVIKGKLVFIIGKGVFYYFMIATVDYNWQSNQAIWNQVLDSIKIDQ